MLLCHLLLICGAMSLVCYLCEKLRRYSVRGVLWKALTSALFVALAICAWAASASHGELQPLGGFVCLGLVFGLLGDVWLDLKYVFPAEDEPFTFAGFGAFGVGHILYCVGLVRQYAQPGMGAIFWLPLLLALLVGMAIAMMEKPMKLRYGKFKPVVAGYGFLLFSTALLSGALAWNMSFRCTGLNLFFAGAVLFVLSDLILSGTYFGEGRDRPVDLLLNYLSYYPAQFLIAYSLLYL